jgi:L-histidine Nalpha-methyltransferase
MLARVGDAEIVELGPGNGAKTRIMIEAALAHQPFVRYRPIDISSSALRALAQSLVAEYDHVAVNAYCGDYRTALLRHPRSAGTTMLVMFLGSSIGNYEPREAARLLRGMVGAMRSCDALLLGTDLKKSRAALELAYNDPGGVSAAFNRNVLARVNRELGGTFDLSKFRFVASYDERRCCIDSFQESLANQTVRIDALGVDVPFASGERIHVESSYKYDAESIAALARDGGFDVSDAWSDAEGRFAVSLLRPVQS